MDHHTRQPVVLPVKDGLHVAVDALRLPQQEALALDPFPPLQRDGLGVDLLGLLVVEEEADLEVELRLEGRDVGLDPEVADVVELDLLLVVPQEEGLREKGTGGMVD